MSVTKTANAIHKPRPFGFRNQLHVQKSLSNASFIAVDELVAGRVDAAHARDVNEITGARAEAPGPGRLNCAFRCEQTDAAAGCHHGVPVCRASAWSTPPICPFSAS